MDIALNSNFSVHLDDRHDLAAVTDRDEFEQSIVVMATDYMHASLPGLTGEQNIREKIRMVVTRVARDHNRLDDIADIDIERSSRDSETYEVMVRYVADTEALNFEVNL